MNADQGDGDRVLPLFWGGGTPRVLPALVGWDPKKLMRLSFVSVPCMGSLPYFPPLRSRRSKPNAWAMESFGRAGEASAFIVEAGLARII